MVRGGLGGMVVRPSIGSKLRAAPGDLARLGEEGGDLLAILRTVETDNVPEGVVLRTTIGPGLHTVVIPEEGLEAILEDPKVATVELSKVLGCRPS